MGTLADARTRAARYYVHQLFDPLWQDYQKQTYAIGTRNETYQWLAQMMGMTADECHASCFNIEQCDRAAQILIRHWLNWITPEELPEKRY